LVTSSAEYNKLKDCTAIIAKIKHGAIVQTNSITVPWLNLKNKLLFLNFAQLVTSESKLNNFTKIFLIIEFFILKNLIIKSLTNGLSKV